MKAAVAMIKANSKHISRKYRNDYKYEHTLSSSGSSKNLKTLSMRRRALTGMSEYLASAATTGY